MAGGEHVLAVSVTLCRCRLHVCLKPVFHLINYSIFFFTRFGTLFIRVSGYGT